MPEEEVADAAVAPASPPIRVGAPRDLSAIMDRARFGFHDTDDGLSADGVGHRVVLLPEAARVETASVSADRVLAIEVGRATITRDGIPLGVPGAGELNDAGDYLVPAGAYVERWRNAPAGAEQSWDFAEAPEGSGELRVSVPVTGGGTPRLQANGLRFTDATGERSLYYGHATWVHAGGREPIPAEFQDGAVQFRVSPEVLAATQWPATLDPIVGPESGGPAGLVAAAPYDQRHPCVARWGTHGLVAWSDYRKGGAAPHVFASRVNGSSPLDTVSVELGPGLLTGENLWLECDAVDNTFLVAWASSSVVQAVRMTAAGVVLDDPPLRLAITGDPEAVDVAASAGQFMVTWIDDADGDGEVRAVRVPTSGAVLDATPLVVTSDAIDQRDPAIAFNGTDYQIVFSDRRGADADIYGARVSTAGTVVDTTPVALATLVSDQLRPAIVFNGTTGMLVYRDTLSASIRGVTMLGNGTASAGTDARVTRGATDDNVAIAFSHGNYQLVWQRQNATSYEIARVEIASPAVGTETLMAVRSFYPDIDGSGNQASIAMEWVGTYDSEYDVYVYSRDTGGWWGANYSQSAEAQNVPQIAANGGRYLVAWMDFDARGLGRLRHTQLYSDGTYVGGISTAGQTGWTFPGNVSVASNGTIWTVMVQGRDTNNVTNVYGLTATTFSGTSLVRDHASRTNPVVVRNGGQFTVYMRGSSTLYRYSRDAQGPITTSATTVHTNQGNYFAATSNGYFYTRYNSSFGISSTIGSTSTTTATSLAPINLAASYGGTSGGHLVVFIDGSTSGDRLFGQHFLANGAANGSPFLIASGAANPAVVHTEDEFLVVYQRSGNLYGQRVSNNGSLVDTAGATISAGPEAERYPQLASIGYGQVIVTYERYVEGPNLNSVRFQTRLIETRMAQNGATGSACTDPWTCASGSCVNGVCCSQPCDGACQVCSVAAGATADGTCTPRPQGTQCRASTGVCDPAEVCTGLAGVCPVDARSPSGTVCGAAATGPCDVADMCDGTSAACPTTARMPINTPCRPAAGACDRAEVCNGVAATCPADLVQSSSFTCRASEGVCDVAERCDGVTVDCPAQQVRDASTICRNSTGECDPTENCDGVSPACPTDERLPSGFVCRVAQGPCDVAETCNGQRATCPSDVLRPANFVCREARGVCDVEEVCAGDVAACPADELHPALTVCRNSDGVCDVAEVCDGETAHCSADRLRADGSSCDDGLYCNGEGTCAAGECVGGEAVTCEAANVCNEVLQACAPPDLRTAGCAVQAPGRSEGTWLVWCLCLGLLGWRRRR